MAARKEKSAKDLVCRREPELTGVEKEANELYETLRERVVATFSETKAFHEQSKVMVGEYPIPGIAEKRLLFGIIPVYFVAPACNGEKAVQFSDDPSAFGVEEVETGYKLHAGEKDMLCMMCYAAVENRPEVFADLLIGGTGRYLSNFDNPKSLWYWIFIESKKHMPWEEGYRWNSKSRYTLPIFYDNYETADKLEKAKTIDELFEAIMETIKSFQRFSIRIVVSPWYYSYKYATEDPKEEA